jgi:hypothetical protein
MQLNDYQIEAQKTATYRESIEDSEKHFNIGIPDEDNNHEQR